MNGTNLSPGGRGGVGAGQVLCVSAADCDSVAFQYTANSLPAPDSPGAMAFMYSVPSPSPTTYCSSPRLSADGGVDHNPHLTSRSRRRLSQTFLGRNSKPSEQEHGVPLSPLRTTPGSEKELLGNASLQGQSTVFGHEKSAAADESRAPELGGGRAGIFAALLQNIDLSQLVPSQNTENGATRQTARDKDKAVAPSSNAVRGEEKSGLRGRPETSAGQKALPHACRAEEGFEVAEEASVALVGPRASIWDAGVVAGLESCLSDGSHPSPGKPRDPHRQTESNGNLSPVGGHQDAASEKHQPSGGGQTVRAIAGDTAVSPAGTTAWASASKDVDRGFGERGDRGRNDPVVEANGREVRSSAAAGRRESVAGDESIEASRRDGSAPSPWSIHLSLASPTSSSSQVSEKRPPLLLQDCLSVS